jgi:hypothetical protein
MADYTLVGAAIKRDRRRARIHNIRAGRLNGQRPDRDAAIGKTKPLPMIAAMRGFDYGAVSADLPGDLTGHARPV